MKAIPPLTPFEVGLALRLYIAHTKGLYGILHPDDVHFIHLIMRDEKLTRDEAIIDLLKLYDWRMSNEWGSP